MFGFRLALPALLCLTGCATILASKSKMVPLASTPSGAEVLLDGNPVGVTPMQLKVDHGKSHTVTFRKAGHRDMTCQLSAKTGAGWVVLDVLTGLVPMLGI